MMDKTNDWWIYKGTSVQHDEITRKLPDPPNWRKFSKFEDEKTLTYHLGDSDDPETKRHIGDGYQVGNHEIDLVNAALYLRRPLLVTGQPGSGKSSLAYAVAHELKLGRVLHWAITTHSTLAEGLYDYDAIGRLENASLKHHAMNNSKIQALSLNISHYLRLGPLGTALLPWKYPRVLLIDEIDKSDIDLPNSLLNIFEEGKFDIPKLQSMALTPAYNNDSSEKVHRCARLPILRYLTPAYNDDSNEKETKPVYVMPYDGKKDSDRVPIRNGHVQCHAFPFVVLTSNGEREFPPAFLRRCLRLRMPSLEPDKLEKIVKAHLGPEVLEQSQTKQLIKDFLQRQTKEDLATDQLLNAIYMAISGITLQNKEKLCDSLLESLTRQR